MNYKNLIIILFTVIFSISQPNAEQFDAKKTTDKRTITLKGKIDPRLYAYVMSIYRPTDTSNTEECLSKYPNWGTGTRKDKLTFYSATIISDQNNNYEVTIPIDFISEDKCGYEYTGTDLTIRRDKEDDLYAKFSVTSNSRAPRHIKQGDKTGTVSVHDVPKMPANTNGYYQLPNNTKIKCFTRHFERSQRLDHVYPERDRFICYEEYEGSDNGVSWFETTTITVDINVDETRNVYIYSSESENRGKKEPESFRDYQPGLFERMKRKLTAVYALILLKIKGASS